MRCDGRVLAVGLIAAILAGLAPGPARADPPPGLPRLWEEPLPAASSAPTATFANRARMFGDITYAARPGYRPLKLDLYLPAPRRAGRGPLPLIVWIHGGGYEIGNPRADWTWGDWRQVLARAAARGYAVAAISYRFKREAVFPAQLDDTLAALAFLRGHAARWNIDGGRVYVWGLSAGGHMAALVGMRSGGNVPAAEKVQGVVDWFGPTDLGAIGQGRSNDGIAAGFASLLGCPEAGCDAAALAAASPVSYVTPQAPPTLIMHGEADRLVPVAQGAALADRLRAAGASVDYRPMPGLGHGFDGATPAQLDRILAATLDFLDRLSARK